MKINIVNYEQGIGMNGILSKYAREMHKHLVDLGHQCTVSSLPDPKAKINHHINYISYRHSGTPDTTMITHVSGDKNMSEKTKINLIKEQAKTATGICFSEGMKKKIGIDKIEVVLPAHDSLPRRPRIIAISTNLYPDGRKREKMFSDMVRSLKDQSKFAFRIMGKGWEKTLNPLMKLGLRVHLVPEFVGDIYQELLQTSDYMLYTGGEDALAQSIIDAKQAGLRIIAPPQEDLIVDLPFESQKELNYIFAQMEENEVEDWSWDNYVKSHLKIWRKLV